MNPKKLLLYYLTPILACSMLSGVGFASHKKKDTGTAATTTQTATANQASTAATPVAKTEPSKATRKTSPATTSTASASDIANAKAKGLVWVNTESKVYHTGGKYYGNTKHGQFMSAADAQKAGYRASKI